MEDNVTKIHDHVLVYRRVKVHEIAETVGISKDRVGHILHEILGMRKLLARWGPCLLTPDNKRNRETTSEQCLTLFKRNLKEFLCRFMTVDETWIHWYTPEPKEQLEVYFTWRTCSEEGEDCPIGQKGDGHRFLGFTKCEHRLPGEGQNGNYAELLGRFDAELQKCS